MRNAKWNKARIPLSFNQFPLIFFLLDLFPLQNSPLHAFIHVFHCKAHDTYICTSSSLISSSLLIKSYHIHVVLMLLYCHYSTHAVSSPCLKSSSLHTHVFVTMYIVITAY